MIQFLLALQFLTILPIKFKDFHEKKLTQSLILFPLVGLMLGVILAVANNLLRFLYFNELAVSASVIVLLIILTGGMHLDGLADTFDAFLSRKNKDEMLAIMRDSRTGAMGVISLISVILLKIVFFHSLNPSIKIPGLILMCVLSRWAMVYSIFLFPYARKEGKAGIFMRDVSRKIFLWATVITLLIIFCTLYFKGLLVWLMITAITYLSGRFITGMIGGLTGDTLGALNEIIEVIVLFLLCILARGGLCLI
ncbi:MAG: adenosylcobinamide-GDP ribazoletransferase [Candidatus Omnitrophota bacterium]|nr:adenosylcobinamide-GDP ribazoletransferase [Candidatus Omnitrophota bacterium]MBU1929651.1 adenosylcobinamide-GDP ribazoletransferase [Candidatus Omnitrophota bacterium]MBU2035393.1 adenosylcobinamide-GDP ribazoletransferase [Candidatus Omnitrophota bacterium]MBU2221763.1 adenosylcobinamide-GDP ribazoletransferase [Candidatus Omnitrophota bacterium]MBU2258151.1 adenosylcobinamide-GDP ribazoletransferase [Candidatus Omnitrophota bacterium]